MKESECIVHITYDNKRISITPLLEYKKCRSEPGIIHPHNHIDRWTAEAIVQRGDDMKTPKLISCSFDTYVKTHSDNTVSVRNFLY